MAKPEQLEMSLNTPSRYTKMDGYDMDLPVPSTSKKQHNFMAAFEKFWK